MLKQARNADARALGPCPQDGVCHLCGRPAIKGDPLTWDHLIPVSKGGAGKGVLPAHRSCNSRRGAGVV